MRRVSSFLLLLIFSSCLSSWPQNNPIVIPAGTPEDKDLAIVLSGNRGQIRVFRSAGGYHNGMVLRP